MYYNNSTSVIIYYCFDKEGTLAIIMAIYLFIVVFGLPLLFMSFCYFRVIVELWMSTVTMSAMTRINRSVIFLSLSLCLPVSPLPQSLATFRGGRLGLNDNSWYTLNVLNIGDE